MITVSSSKNSDGAAVGSPPRQAVRFAIVLTRTNDEHTDRLTTALRARGLECIRVNRDRILDYAFEFIGDALTIRAPDGVFEAHQAVGVFVRTIPSPADFGPVCDTEFASIEQYVALQRSSLFTDWLAALTARVPVINPVGATSQIMGKGSQRQLALGLGLTCPDLYIGEHAEAAKRFILPRPETTVYCTKPIANKTVLIDGVRHTRFTEKLAPNSAEHLDSLAGCPIIFQPYVEKMYELRVTVIGASVLACKIASQQAGGATATDWRRYNIPKTPHEPYALPHRLAEQLLLFHEAAGLTYSAFDLIRSKDGEYVFLETNPFGQWLWIEDLTGLRITDAIADALAGSE